MERYRIRYSRVISGLINAKQLFAIDFDAEEDEVLSVAAAKWKEVVDRKYIIVDFIDLVKVLDWKP